MGRILTGLAVKALGAFALGIAALVVLSIVLSIVLGIIATIVTTILAVAVLGVLVLAIVGVYSLYSDGRDRSGDRRHVEATSDEFETQRDRNPTERLQERYVAGDIDETEFERRMDHLLKSSETGAVYDVDADPGGDRSKGIRDRLLDR